MIEQFPIFHLRIANEGKTSANRLRLAISHDFFSYGNRQENHNLARFNAFNNEIACFPPGSEPVFPLAKSFVIFAADADLAVTPSRFSVTASYAYSEKTVVEKTEIDLTAYL